MARKKRFFRVGNFHHVMLRGNQGQNLFAGNEDYCRFCLYLQEAAEKHLFKIHAFCLMTNHIHLVVEPMQLTLSSGIHAFSFRYAQYYNKRYDMRGHLFQDRYKCICVEDGTYLKRLIRYVHLNPFHAGLVVDPIEYRWSSHKAYLGKEDIYWLNKSRVLARFHPHEDDAVASLEEFIQRKIDARKDISVINQVLQNGFMKVEEDERIKILYYCSLSSVVDFICNHFGVTVNDLSRNCQRQDIVKCRYTLCLLVGNSSNWTLADLSPYFNRSLRSIYMISKRANCSNELINLSNLLSDELIKHTKKI